MGIPVDWKPERAVQEKLGTKSVWLCPVESPYSQTLLSSVKFEWYGSIQSASAKQQSDETLKDIKAIEELKPSGIIPHSCFSFFYINLYNFHFFGGILLLERQPPCTKTPITGQLQKSIQIYFHKKLRVCFSFSVLFRKNVQRLIFYICIWKWLLLINIYIRNKRQLLLIPETGAKTRSAEPYSYSSQQVPG